MLAAFFAESRCRWGDAVLPRAAGCVSGGLRGAMGRRWGGGLAFSSPGRCGVAEWHLLGRVGSAGCRNGHGGNSHVCFAHGAAKKIFRPSFAPHPRALRGFCLSLTPTAKKQTPPPH